MRAGIRPFARMVLPRPQRTFTAMSVPMPGAQRKGLSQKSSRMTEGRPPFFCFTVTQKKPLFVTMVVPPNTATEGAVSLVYPV